MKDEDSIELKIKELGVIFLRNSMFDELLNLEDAIKYADSEKISNIVNQYYYLL